MAILLVGCSLLGWRNSDSSVFQGRLRSFPPKAVLGPAFTPGWRDTENICFNFVVLSGPFTGLLLAVAVAVAP